MQSATSLIQGNSTGIEQTVETKPLSIDAKQIPNAVLQRLIAEVKHDRENNIFAYNRTHNRHNRGR